MNRRTLRIALTSLTIVAVPIVLFSIFPGEFVVPRLVSVLLAVAGVVIAGALAVMAATSSDSNSSKSRSTLRFAAPMLTMSAALVSPTTYQPYLLILALMLSGWAWQSKESTPE